MLTLYSPEQLQHPRTEQPQLSGPQASNSDTCIDIFVHNTVVDMPFKVSKASNISECSTLPSAQLHTSSDPSLTQACTAVLQQSGGVRIVQTRTQCHVTLCHCLEHDDSSGGGERHHLLDNLQPSPHSHENNHHHPSFGTQ